MFLESKKQIFGFEFYIPVTKKKLRNRSRKLLRYRSRRLRPTSAVAIYLSATLAQHQIGSSEYVVNAKIAE